MTTLIVGGDHVDTYRAFLSASGYGPVMHLKGRKPRECDQALPRHTRLVVIMVDQVSHGLALRMRRAANAQNLPVVFTKRSISQLNKALDRMKRGGLVQ
ncbi:DUF2325 domain-containing protein [Propionivibrio sp.]|jgi:hypothetical protein|uniref:DUF2325 domain-containing protein n=1 Tax=Propionivibrio sp. TaxID=2212460 RepID=UPI0039E6CC80